MKGKESIKEICDRILLKNDNNDNDISISKLEHNKVNNVFENNVFEGYLDIDTLNRLKEIEKEEKEKSVSVPVPKSKPKPKSKSMEFLPMPDIGESVTVKTLSSPKIVKSRFNVNERMLIVRCSLIDYDIYDPRYDGKEYNLIITSTIYKGMITELRRNQIVIDGDGDMKYIVNLIFKISGIKWLSAPRDLWKISRGKIVAPKIYSVELLPDNTSEMMFF